MRIRQYVYLAVKSETMDAGELTARIGLDPDEVMVRGTRSADPPRPAAHAWKIVCGDPGLAVDEMISRLIDRAEPFAAAIGELALSESRARAVLQVVRHLDADEGEEEDLTCADPAFERVPGQHRLLGWQLDHRALRFLSAAHAELDVDEYG